MASIETCTYHDVLHSLTLFAEYVLHGDFYIVQFDESRPASLAATHGDLAHAHALLILERNKQNAKSSRTITTCPYTHGCIFAPHTIGDPFLGAVHNEMLAIRGSFGGRLHICNLFQMSVCLHV